MEGGAAEMPAYQCPICNQEIPRDLVLFLDHTNEHIVDEIKRQHPDWVATDGVCQKCVEYFRSQFKK